jgi:hypothetical protein
MPGGKGIAEPITNKINAQYRDKNDETGKGG